MFKGSDEPISILLKGKAMAYSIINSNTWWIDIVRNEAANFYINNTILEDGQIGLENDTGKFKIGDGVTPWNTLVFQTANNATSFLPGPSNTAGNLLSIDPTDGGFVVRESLNAEYFTEFNPVVTTADKLIAKYTSELAAKRLLGRGHVTQLYAMLCRVAHVVGSQYNMNPALASSVTSIGSRLNALETAAGDDISTVIDNRISGYINDTGTSTTTLWSAAKIKGMIESLGDSTVDQKIAALVGSAPEALNTIWELAAALQENVSGVTTLTTMVSNSVKVTAQTYTTAQQTQARANIKAASTDVLGTLPATSDVASILAAALADTTTAATLTNIYA